MLRICNQIEVTRKIHKQLKAYPNLRVRCNQSRGIPTPLQFKMIRCPAGVIVNENDSTGNIKIEKPFFLCESEVTQELYREVMGYNPSTYQGAKYPNSDRHPVERMTIYDALLFCNKLSLIFGLKPYYKLSNIKKIKNRIDKAEYTINKDSNGFKLPCTSEWMYAAYAGTKNIWAGCNDKDRLEDYAWSVANSAIAGENQTHSVKMKKPNDWGFYDMTGNVSEFAFHPNEEDQKGFGMGGSFQDGYFHNGEYNYYDLQISKYHNYLGLGNRNSDLGFRLSRNIIL